ncbi:TRM11 family SAM-dependent methyltransferase [Cohnella terricola]|uniref:RNA methyltransferase n=1 Tax=Cohnella terricola TaxID=1289167 RepID=A0A559JTX3_9BACL|nr:RNA methyltransferase [Cohnella terricola]TVY03280.1 RNA methyltransferase [Cohnella terricola]
MIANDYVYELASNDEERGLRLLETRTLLESNVKYRLVRSKAAVDPSRSPFIKSRLSVLFEGDRLEDIADRVGVIELNGATFKVHALDHDDPAEGGKFDYDRKRAMEREIGYRFRGKAEMRSPDREFGFARMGGRWLFGELARGQAVWLKHKEKPREYSTALSTRVARAVVNIAVPRIEGVRAIDPCCGIGTVLVEAASMGIEIEGRDVNPLAAVGARENLAHFGYGGSVPVTLGDMREITGQYDAAVIDMPYNLCSVLSPREKLEMLRSARAFANRIVVVTLEDLDSIVAEAGFDILDRCTVNKGKFVRQVLICE